MKQLLMCPVWVIQLFTQTKSFSKNPLLGNRWLNTLGLHVTRMVLAHGIMRARMWTLSRSIDPALRKAYFQDGFIVVPNFLRVESHQALTREIFNARAEVRECTQGDTLTHRILLDQSTLASLSLCDSVLQRDDYRRLHRFASGKRSTPISYIQTIKNHYVEGPSDPQKNLHSDTFHPTMKSWYFLDDVDETNGPFTYVPGSHRLTLDRLKWEYHKSIEISRGGDRYSGNGSLRINEYDAKAMNLQAPRAFKVSANTLVIANTHGFHCRGQANERSTRTELWTISRSNPFNPFPGFDNPAISEIQNRALSAWRRYCDRRANARGAISSWHVVDARNTIRSD